jgi:hypothetical protein
VFIRVDLRLIQLMGLIFPVVEWRFSGSDNVCGRTSARCQFGNRRARLDGTTASLTVAAAASACHNIICISSLGAIPSPARLLLLATYRNIALGAAVGLLVWLVDSGF